MPPLIPDSFSDLIDGPIFVTLITVMPDGQPQASVMWCKADDSHVLFSTTQQRQKARNMARDPKVTIMAFDPGNPYRFVEIRGSVEELTTEGGVDLIDELAQLYEGKPSFYGPVAAAELRDKETRVVCRIRPTRVRTSA